MTEERLRILLIAEAANPEWTSVPLVGWSHASALREVADVHVVTSVRNREAILRAGWREGEDFTAVDHEWIARPVWRLERGLRRILRTGWMMAMALQVPVYPWFERAVWRRFGERLQHGEFDLVHRLTPLSPVVPSPIARRCTRAGVPFVWGPINGGLPYPKGYRRLAWVEGEWLAFLRMLYRLVPGYRATRRHAAVIVAGSRATEDQLGAAHRDKVVYLPENGFDPDRLPGPVDRPVDGPLRICFVGRLVPYKGCDLLIESLEQLLARGQVELTIYGDGPMRRRLEGLVSRKRLGGAVGFAGWVDHDELQHRFAAAHVLGFPSLREFGGGVVLEAMALGVVPVVVDHGGPGELVGACAGVAVPPDNRPALVARLREVFTELAADRELVGELSRRGRLRAVRGFSWPAKARQMMQVYEWALHRGSKPDLGMSRAEEAP